MRLSDADRRSLRRIAAAVEDNDPDFAARMTGTMTPGDRSPDEDEAQAPSLRAWGRLVVLCAMAAVGVVAIALMVLGLMGRGAGSAITGGCVLTVDTAAAAWYWLHRRHKRRKSGTDAPPDHGDERVHHRHG